MGKPTAINIRGLRGDQRASELKGVDLSRVLVVAIDSARDFPKALICDYFGKVLEKPFFFSVNYEGINFLHQKIQNWVGCVKGQRVFIGVEVASSYHSSIVKSLENLGYKVSAVNSYTTASERKKMLDYSKTDDKDLIAIAQAIIANNGLTEKRVNGIYETMQLICRTRRQYVTEKAASKIQIRQLMSNVFREFQGMIELGSSKKIKIFSSFWNKKSRFIMKNFPFPSQLLELGEKGIRQYSKTEGVNLSALEINRLLKAAGRDVNNISKEQRIFYSNEIKFKLRQLADKETHISNLEGQIEELLARTPAVLLLTIKGINIVTAAEFIAEVGNILNYTHNRQLVKLAGINPVLSQSGGKKARAYQISRQGNPALRYVVNIIGKNLCSKICRNTYFIDYYQRLAKRGKAPLQIYSAAGNKFIRIAYAMLRNHTTFYVPGYEDSTSDIKDKFKSPKNKEVALKTLEQLTQKETDIKDQLAL